jgi:tRNA modification GTPase
MVEAMLMTPPTAGAIAVITLRGDDVRAVVNGMIGRDLRGGPVQRVKFLHCRTVIDDGLVVWINENEAELHVHGGVAVIEAMFTALVELGVKRAADVQAQSLEEEITAMLPLTMTETAVRLIAGQRIAWKKWIEQVIEKMRGETWRGASAIQWRIERSRSLMRLIRPARVAIVGPPNAGKSTLVNFLLGRKAAITSDIPGTTRDWVDGVALLTSGKVSAPVTLVDTAGIRETPDELEQESIRRTRAQAEAADLVVAVFDGTQGVDENILCELRQCLIVVNKIDLTAKIPAGAIGVSAKNGAGIEALMRTILERLDLQHVDLGEAIVFTQRQQQMLEHAAMARNTDEMMHLLRMIIKTPPF